MKSGLERLGTLGEFKNGVNFKKEAVGEGRPFINVKDITGSHCFSHEALDLVRLEVREDALAKRGDLFFVRSSVKLDGIGLVGQLREGLPEDGVLHCGFVIRFRPDLERVDSDYLMYLLLTPAYRQRLKNLSAGAAIVNISQAALRTLEVPVPPLTTQQRIAEIVRSYDNLIENNRRRIQLLEESARLLYKEWFVHLRFPGHEHTKIINGIPEGWERKKIDAVCETVGGGTPSTKNPDFWDGDITWVVPSDITGNNSIVLLDSERKITERGLRESSAKMVPPETILMTSRASVGYFALMDKAVCTNQGFINILPNNDEYRMYMLYNLLSRVEEIRSNAKGTTYPEISKGRFREMDILTPPRALVIEFGSVTQEIIQQVRCLTRANKQLAAARDLLLPRLMNGEVAV